MTSFKLDKNNNLIVGAQIITISGIEAIAQDCKTRLNMLLGEYPFNTSLGMDYISLLNANNSNILKNAIISELKKDERIKQVIIKNFDIDTKGRSSLALECVLYSGEVINV